MARKSKAKIEPQRWEKTVVGTSVQAFHNGPIALAIIPDHVFVAQSVEFHGDVRDGLVVRQLLLGKHNALKDTESPLVCFRPDLPFKHVVKGLRVEKDAIIVAVVDGTQDQDKIALILTGLKPVEAKAAGVDKESETSAAI